MLMTHRIVDVALCILRSLIVHRYRFLVNKTNRRIEI